MKTYSLKNTDFELINSLISGGMLITALTFIGLMYILIERLFFCSSEVSMNDENSQKIGFSKEEAGR